MIKRIFPSPTMVVACVALLVALGGTAIAAGPVVKRALYADNAGKLAGKTPDALVQQAAGLASQQPGPASTVAGLVTLKTAPWSLAPSSGSDFTVTCDAGQKAVGGGWEDPGGWGHEWDNRPTPDGAGWKIYVGMSQNAPGAQAGTIYAVCLK